MKKMRRLVIGNWKMNPGTLVAARSIFLATRRVAERLRNAEVVLCPPFPFLAPLARLVGQGKNFSIGAQDVFWRNGGSFTGEVSPEMLEDLGLTTVIIGHSERRALGEMGEVIAKKLTAAAREGFRVILCIGERARDDGGDYLGYVRTELAESLRGFQKRYLPELVIAYEPIWAIGKRFRAAAEPREIEEMAIFIRKTLSEMYLSDLALHVPILYGGSVEVKNASEIVSAGNVAGLLVGHESLVPEDFAEILREIDVS